jgi:hypothetical protein
MSDEELKALLAAMEERLMRRIDEVVLSRLDELASDIRDLGVEVARLAKPEPKP